MAAVVAWHILAISLALVAASVCSHRGQPRVRSCFMLSSAGRQFRVQGCVSPSGASGRGARRAACSLQLCLVVRPSAICHDCLCQVVNNFGARDACRAEMGQSRMVSRGVMATSVQVLLQSCPACVPWSDVFLSGCRVEV